MPQGSTWQQARASETCTPAPTMVPRPSTDSSDANLAVVPLTGSTGTKIFLSADYGVTWVVAAAPSTVWRVVPSNASGKRLVAVASQNQPEIWTYCNTYNQPLTNPTAAPSKALGAPTENPTTMPILQVTSAPTVKTSDPPTTQSSTLSTSAPTAPTVAPTALSTPFDAPLTDLPSVLPTMIPTKSPIHVNTLSNEVANPHSDIGPYADAFYWTVS